MHNRIFQTWATLFWHSEFDVCGTKLAGLMLPLFHVMGVMLHIAAPLMSECLCSPLDNVMLRFVEGGLIVVMYNPTRGPVVPTPESVLAALRRSQAEYAMSVPSFCAEWADDPKALEVLKGLKALVGLPTTTCLEQSSDLRNRSSPAVLLRKRKASC
jgi:acyl-CoA synthetase (AMP-forming)/AMP-acid ligase II